MLIKKMYLPEIFLGATLAVAIFSLGVVFESSRQQPSNNDTAANSQGGSAPQTAEKSLDKITDWLLVLFNGLLFGSTVLLWIANNRSARISERALTELESPAVFIEFQNHGFAVNNVGVDIRNRAEIQYVFVNYGRTPAMIRKMADELRPVEQGKGFPPAIDLDRVSPREMGYGVVVPPNGGKSQPFSYNTFKFLLSDDGSAIYELDKIVFLTIAARYTDIFENPYRIGFNFSYDKTVMQFILSGAGSTHNYCYKEKSK